MLLINFIRRKRRGRSHLRIAIRFSTTCTWVGLRPHQTLSSSPLKEFEPFVFVAESLRSPPRSLCLVSSTTAWTWRIRAESRWKSFSKKRLIPDLSAESFFFNVSFWFALALGLYHKRFMCSSLLSWNLRCCDGTFMYFHGCVHLFRGSSDILNVSISNILRSHAFQVDCTLGQAFIKPLCSKMQSSV